MAGSLDRHATHYALLPGLISNATYVQGGRHAGQASAVQNGYLLFRRGEALMAQSFQPHSGEPNRRCVSRCGKVGGRRALDGILGLGKRTLVYASAADAFK